MATPLNTIKNWFKTGLKPTQTQFWAWMDSFWHKDETIPQNKIESLQQSFDAKLDVEAYNPNGGSNIIFGPGFTVGAILGPVGGLYVTLANSDLEDPDDVYQDIAELLANQNVQQADESFFVIDASDAGDVTEGAAIFLLIADPVTGAIVDYVITWKAEDEESTTGSKFLGLFPTPEALNTAHAATAVSGNYADVDAGVGEDVQRYIWDNDDSKFVLQQGTGGTLTGSEIKAAYEAESDTNAFTNAEKSKLSALLPSIDKYTYSNTYTSPSTVFNGTQKGDKNIQRFESETAQQVTIDEDDYNVGDPIVIDRAGNGELEILAPTGKTFEGVRDLENRFFLPFPSTMAFGIKQPNGKIAWQGCRSGFTGRITITSYSDVFEDTTVDMVVLGSGFSSNMKRPEIINSGGAVINSFNYIDNENITLNITINAGTSGSDLDIRYDNGSIYDDISAITIGAVAGSAITLQTTSTSASFSPQTVSKSGDILKWTVTGDASGIYDANDPTIDLSGNTGVATITITSDDDLAGLTTCRFNTLSLVALDVTDWVDCTELFVFGNSGLTEIVGLDSLQIPSKFDVRNNGLTTLGTGIFPNLTNLQATGIKVTTLDAGVQFPNLQTLALTSSNLNSLNVTGLSSLTTFICGSYKGTSFIGLNTLSAMTQFNSTSGLYTTLDLTGSPLVKTVTIQVGQLTASSLNNVILTLDGHGLSNGTLNYISNANNPTATESVANDVLDAYNSLVAKGWSITGTIPS